MWLHRHLPHQPLPQTILQVQIQNRSKQITFIPKRITEAERLMQENERERLNEQIILLKDCKTAIIVLKNVLTHAKLTEGVDAAEQLLERLKNF